MDDKREVDPHACDLRLCPGTKLAALPGEDITRPTVDRVKEGMFSALQFILPGAKVLDLFAGSGQLGIEALSRGAASCVFVDQDRGAVRIVEQNCKAAGVQAQSRIRNTRADTFLASCGEQFHIVLLDPPYRHDTLAQILPQVARGDRPRRHGSLRERAGSQPAGRVRGPLQEKQYRYGPFW